MKLFAENELDRGDTVHLSLIRRRRVPRHGDLSMPDRIGTVTLLLRDIQDAGADPVRGGYSRPTFSTAELDLRAWFRAGRQHRPQLHHAARLDVPSGERTGAVVTDSHLDSVPGGGAFDGSLGVASALSAVDLFRERGHRPERPLTEIAGSAVRTEQPSRKTCLLGGVLKVGVGGCFNQLKQYRAIATRYDKNRLVLPSHDRPSHTPHLALRAP